MLPTRESWHTLIGIASPGHEKSVLVTNTFLPADSESRSTTGANARPCAVASVDLPSLQTRCFFYEQKEQQSADTHVLDVSFDKSDDEALVLLKQGSKGEILQRYHLDDRQWSLVSSDTISGVRDRLRNEELPSATQNQSVQVSIRQGYNSPPALWASDSRTGRALQLWDPNPQFARIRFGDASAYNWNDSTGREWKGVLVKPVGYVPGRRYPLVLQMYSFVEDEFVTDGLVPSAFAARHLASAGFVVLQIKKQPNTLSEADPRTHLEGYRSAVEDLDKAGLIDRSRVGVVAFSWSCWYAINALIKEPKLFAAATISEGLDNSYMQYLLFAPEGEDIERQMQQIRGTAPFGAGLERWVQEAPGFNLDRVETPVRIEAMGPLSVLQEWELYASLRLQHKPVDLIYFPEGTHIHQKPFERLESQQGDVDWFRFWLQGYEDPDPSKADQYKLWDHLRELQAADVANGTSSHANTAQ
jgi:dipeptidyl aminopeptidase/acylaminoacyl peptidase